MPHLDSKGPEGKGASTGRGLGKCKKTNKPDWPLGQGMGKKRRSDDCGDGNAKRLKSGKIFDSKK